MHSGQQNERFSFDSSSGSIKGSFDGKESRARSNIIVAADEMDLTGAETAIKTAK